jgi:hypothetical protein
MELSVNINYKEQFPDEDNHCRHLKDGKYLKYPVISQLFKEAMEENVERKNVYEHYVCAECALPSPFYVMFCWVGQHFYYGFKHSERCTECKGL